ncbi:MAG TPA: hypothetical protein VLU96_09690 [Gaiellaceae bacterium]|nr:hypothetical protein [Gaiellaceae bacterium]
MKLSPGARSLWLLGAASALVLVASAVFFGAGRATRPARAASPSSNLYAQVVPTARGPLTSCSEAPCSSATTVWHFIHVVNANPLTNEGGASRAIVPNSFVVDSVDWRVFVNGAEVPEFATTVTPPPDPSGPLSWSGRWPTTVTCQGQPGSFFPPCNVVGSPTVLPGENTVVFYLGWIHGNTEPNGWYVFKYTIHGTLNGNPVDLTASSPPIRMTS